MIDLNRLFVIRLSRDLFVLSKEEVSYNLFLIGMVITFYGSLNPWFMWPLGQFSVLLACGFVVSSMMVSATMEKTIFNKNNYLLPIVAYILLVYYQNFINEQNFTSYIFQLFNICIFYSLFRINEEGLQRLTTILAKSMGLLLAVSIPMYVLYIFGFPLPSSNAEFGDYTFSNYYFFLLDDRDLFTIISRFHSVFLEPGQMGTATVLLLLSQSGKWRKWYNIVLITATLISFSLAAYVLFFVAIFLNLWIQRKNIIRKLVLTFAFISSIIIGSFFYNDGYNLVHDLILVRLEVQDGQLAGDNRVDDSFQADFESFLESSDILTGRDMERMWGNSGYKVFLYDYGIIGILLLLTFYATAMANNKDRRTMISALTIATLNFIVRDYPLWYVFFIPVYELAHQNYHENSIRS